MKFSIKDFFSKWDQIQKKLQICSNLLTKSLMKNLNESYSAKSTWKFTSYPYFDLIFKLDFGIYFHFLVVQIWLLIFYLWQRLSVSFLESFVFHYYLCSFKTTSNTFFVESFFKATFSKHVKKQFKYSTVNKRAFFGSLFEDCLTSILFPHYIHIDWMNRWQCYFKWLPFYTTIWLIYLINYSI